MNGFIGNAIKALFDEGVEHKAIVKTIGNAAWRRPVSILEIRDVAAEGTDRPVYRWEASFQSREEAMRFDQAVRAACQQVAREEG